MVSGAQLLDTSPQHINTYLTGQWQCHESVIIMMSTLGTGKLFPLPIEDASACDSCRRSALPCRCWVSILRLSDNGLPLLPGASVQVAQVVPNNHNHHLRSHKRVRKADKHSLQVLTGRGMHVGDELSCHPARNRLEGAASAFPAPLL